MSSSLTTDFNVSPYFDDYDEDKRYSRILYRPAVAVQARELTQSQTILQAQIQRFGDHIFKDGSIVDGVGIIYYANVHYISVEDVLNTNPNTFISELANNNYLVTNMNETQSSNAVRGVIKLAIDGNKVAAPFTNRLYIDYISTGTNTSTNTDINEFQPGDTLYFYSSSQSKLGTLDSTNQIDSISTLSSNGSFTSNGYAYCVGVTDGTIYQKGFFSKVPGQTIAVGNTLTTNVNGYVVGFDTVETIVTENQDTSLNDNALGYDNENAPGAHRLKLTPTLVSKTISDTANNTNFFAITQFDQNQPTQQKSDPQYAALQKALAERTYDESGDYVIRPFKLDTLPSANGNANTFDYEISSGTAYIRGNRIDKMNSVLINTVRATTTNTISNSILTANYGNYVICNEYVGTFDDELLQSVSLYDTRQRSITDIEGNIAGPVGTAIGTANIRAVVYYTGDRGTSEAQYYLYLFNIQMSTGKTFSAVQSIYGSTGSFGIARADIVLENDLAVLKNASATSLVWNTGIPAVKSISNASFVFTQTTGGTLLTTGNVSITIETPAPGYTTQTLKESVGTYSTGAILADYNIFSNTDVVSSNLTGTIAYTSGNGTITGTTTYFANNFKVGSLIKYSNSTSADAKAKVVSVASNTSMVITPVPTSTYSGNVHQRYYISGTPLPIVSIEVLAGQQQFVANTGLALSASSTVYASYPVYRSGASSIGKVINKSTLVKISCSNNVGSSVGPWDLGLVDVLKIKNVYVGTSFTGLEVATNLKTEFFTLDNGQRDEIYDHAKLYVKPAYASQITTSTVMTVELDHFTANTTTGVGFFSISSYPIDDANTANTTAIKTADIPIYNSIDLRSAVDVRARKLNTAGITSTNTLATVNPFVSNNSFDVYANGQHTIAPDNNFQASFEYYLPRQDLITINSNGDATVQKGIPAAQPRLPTVENDQSIIAEVYVPGYPSLTQREAETYNSFNNAIKINLKSNRRYTMKDIGGLEDRIKRIEYYTVLNALEQGAKDLNIPDANGLNRFKNGIFADAFNSHNNGYIKDIEYKIAIDAEETVARPTFVSTPVDYKYVSASSSNVAQLGSYVMLDYTHDLFVKQQYATKFRVCCESVWSWNGIINLYPSIDAFTDTTIAPAQNINIDLTSAARDFAAGPQGKIYGEARSTSKQTKKRVDAHHDLYTTTTTQSQTITEMKVDVAKTNVDLGSRVTDVSINPYMRATQIGFIARNMKPNTVVHAFFDSVNVDQYCAPGVQSPTAINTLIAGGKIDQVVTRNGVFGGELLANSSGGVTGVFNIPAQTFRTGDRLFQLTNISDLVTGGSAMTTSSKATYSASGLSVTKQSTTLVLEEPVIKYETHTEVTTSVKQVLKWHPDPIAQSFTIDGLPSNVTGIMLSKVGVYFQAKDQTLGVSLLVCEMTNNQPDSSKIIGRAYLTPSGVTANPTLPTTETVFTLDYPVFLLNATDYAFIVEPDGNSPEYTVWVGETGGTDVNTGTQVFSNPYSGIMFVSANEKTWTPIQKEDMMFNLYRAKFTKTSGTAVFNNDDEEYITYINRSYQNSNNTIDIGDVAYTINTTSGAFNTANTISGSPFGRVYYHDSVNNKVYLDSSNGGFSSSASGFNPTIGFFRVPDTSTNTSIGGLANTAQINATSIVAIATISSLANLTYHALQHDFGSLEPATTSLSYGYKGVVGSTQDATFTTVPNGREYEFLDSPRAIKSKSNEGGTKSATFAITLNTDTNYSSPVINLKRKAVHVIENIINNDATNEHSKYGSAVAKYISKTVTLANGQDAEDLKVYLTAYRPLNTDIKVYGKFLNAQDPETFDSKFWTELSYANDSGLVYSSTTDVENYIEYEFVVPSTSAYVSITGTLNTNTLITSPSSNTGIYVGQILTSTNIPANTAVASLNSNGTITMSAAATGSGSATINAAPSTAFANSTSLTSVPLPGTIAITNNSVTLTGTGTTFLTSFTPGATIKIAANNSFFVYRKIVSITSDTSMTVDLGMPAANSATVSYTYSTAGNDGILEYQSSTGSRFIGYKQFGIKIVLLSNNAVQVPRLQDVRAIALQI